MLHKEVHTLLIILLHATTLTTCQESFKVCVIPTEYSICNCSVPCHTFEHYLSHAASELYLLNYLTLEFLPGIHQVTKTFSDQSRESLHLTGTNATIEYESKDNTSWFSLISSTNISFSDLHFRLVSEGKPLKCRSSYVFNFDGVYKLLLSNVLIENRCGGGMFITNTQKWEVSFESVTFSTWYYGLHLLNMHCVVDISHCYFYGSEYHLLLWAEYKNTIPSSDVKLNIQHSEFHNGSGSIKAYVSILENRASLRSPSDEMITLSLSMKHILCSTPNGSDISIIVFSRDGIFIDIAIEKVRLLHGRISTGMFLDFATCYGKYNIKIDECIVTAHSDGAIDMSLGSNQESLVSITNSVIKNNQASPYHVPVSGMVIKGSPNPDLNPVTVIRNVIFESNSFLTSASIDTVVTVMLFFVNRCSITECHFKNNIGTALYLENSSINVNGNLAFVNNTAHNGAAMYLNGPSVVYVNENTSIVFRDNRAVHTGGAIYINSGSIDQILFTLNDGLPIGTPCFIHVTGSYLCKNDSCILHFENNSAFDGGDAVYGGNLGQVYYHDSSTKCITALVEMSKLKRSVSSIASSPSRVCLCDKHSGVADCLKYLYDIFLYPGQTFNISAFTVGQHFGTVRGSVYAQILNKSSHAYISSNHRLQMVGIHNCHDESNVLTYDVTTPHFQEKEILVLTAQDVVVSDYVDTYEVDKAKHSYHHANKTYIPTELLTLPVYITLHFSKCPGGFAFSESGCLCTPLFLKNSKNPITCDIDTQTIRRQYNVWIDASNTITKYSKHCPLLYCNPSVVKVNFSTEDGADVQCINHHSGVLCGACQENYSLAIGSSNCLPQCSDNNLSLLLLFAVVGVLLVLFIKYLNLTITQGMISGFIFYANIVQTNKNVLLSSEEPAVKAFAAIIAWLNLDFGIETCFYKGLDMYTKTWLQFVFPLYLWALAGGIILACRYSQLVTKFFGNNAVQVLATIFLLSYNKLLRIIITVYSSSTIDVENENGDTWEDVVWTYDGNVPYLGTQHAALFAACTAVFIFLWLPFTLCLLLGHWLQRYNHYWAFKWLGRIRPLLDAYYGPLKDNCRYWVGVLLLARVVVILPAADPLASDSASMLAIIVLGTFLLLAMVAFGGAYKDIRLTLLESAIFTNLTLFAALSLYFDDVNSSQSIAVYVMVGLYLLGLIFVIANQLFLLFVQSLMKVRRHDYENVQASTVADEVDER